MRTLLVVTVFCRTVLVLSNSLILPFTETPTSRGWNCMLLNFILSTLNQNSSFLRASQDCHRYTVCNRVKGKSWKTFDTVILIIKLVIGYFAFKLWEIHCSCSFSVSSVSLKLPGFERWRLIILTSSNMNSLLKII